MLEFELDHASCEDRKNEGSSGLRTVVDLYGRTTAGDSICVHVPVFNHVLLQLPPNTTQDDAKAISRTMTNELANTSIAINMKMYHSLMYFQSDPVTGERRRLPFLECLCLNKDDTSAILRNSSNKFLHIEGDISPVLRLLQKRGLVPAGIALLPRHLSPVVNRLTHCTLEFECLLEALEPSPRQDQHAPKRVHVAHFTQDSIAFSLLCSTATTQQDLLTFRVSENSSASSSSSPSSAATDVLSSCIVSYKTRQDMLTEWREVIRTTDPDVVVTWGACPEDIPSRRKIYGGIRGVPGRLVVDLQKLLAQQFKDMGSGRLAVVAQTKLSSPIPEHPVHQMTQLLRDTQVLETVIEMARVSMVFPQELLLHGEVHRSKACLFKHARDMEYVLTPSPPSAKNDSYQGGKILEAKIGLFGFVCQVDYARMYASVIQQHNICYSSLLEPGSPLSRKDCFVQTTELGTFTYQQKYLGVLPSIVSKLVAAREEVQRKRRGSDCEKERRLLDHRQKAIKLTTNALYGFTAAEFNETHRHLPLAATITARAREVLTETERKLRMSAANIICGHTDSLAFQLPECSSIDDLLATAKPLVDSCGNGFLSLQIEHLFHPMLVLGKEAYAGLSHTPGRSGQPPEFVSRGMPNGSRGFAPIVQEMAASLLQAVLRGENEVFCAALVEKSLVRMAKSTDVLMLEFIMSKKIKRYYTHPFPAHKILADQLANSHPHLQRIGDRVEYVVLPNNCYQHPCLANLHEVDRGYYVKSSATFLAQVFRVVFRSERGAHLTSSLINSLEGQRSLPVTYSCRPPPVPVRASSTTLVPVGSSSKRRQLTLFDHTQAGHNQQNHAIPSQKTQRFNE